MYVCARVQHQNGWEIVKLALNRTANRATVPYRHGHDGWQQQQQSLVTVHEASRIINLSHISRNTTILIDGSHWPLISGATFDDRPMLNEKVSQPASQRHKRQRQCRVVWAPVGETPVHFVTWVCVCVCVYVGQDKTNRNIIVYVNTFTVWRKGKEGSVMIFPEG